MAISSYPFPNQDTTEDQYSDLFRQLQDGGVAASPTDLDFKVYADSTGMQVKVHTGFGIVRGYAIKSTAIETLPIAPASGVDRIDRVVLRLSPASDVIVIAVQQGDPGAGAPGLQQTDYGYYEVSLGLVSVPANATTISADKVTDDRRFLGTRVRAYSGNGQRPGSPRVGQLGFNMASASWEYWDGTQWLGLTDSGFTTSIYQGNATNPAPSGTFAGPAQINAVTVPAKPYPTQHRVVAGGYIFSNTDVYDFWLRKDGNNMRRARINPQGTETGFVEATYLVPANTAVTYSTTLSRFAGTGSGSASTDTSVNYIEVVVTKGVAG